MSDTVDVGDLIKRLEEASEGSRELDAEIARRIGQPSGPLSEVLDDGKEIWHHAAAPHPIT